MFRKPHARKSGRMLLQAKCPHYPCRDVVGVDQEAPITAVSGHVACRCGKVSPHLGSKEEATTWINMHINNPEREDIPARDVRGARFGQAGQSLSSSQAHDKFGANVVAGQIGERALAAKLQNSSETRAYSLFQSLGIPAKPGSKRYSSDVDMALINGNRVVLIDAKQWSARKFYWSLAGTVFENFSVKRDRRSNEPVTMSKNMDMAVNRYREYLPGCVVLGMVVFVPSKAGLPSGVSLLRWPGGIKSYLPNDAIRRIHRFLGEPTKPKDDLFQKLNSQLKR